MATVALPDLPSFRVVPPRDDLKLTDLKLQDGTPMIGPDGLLVPPARSFSAVYNAATRVYSSRFDEAMRDNFIAARAMRRDGFLDGLFEERIQPTINRTWQLEVDDDTDPTQALVRDGLTKIVQNIPDFDQFKRANLDAVWFGRAGCQWSFKRNDEIDDLWGIPRWDPLHGDSIQYTFDGVPAIMLDSMTTGWYSSHGASWGTHGDGDLRPTDRGGTALVLQRPYWRNRFTIHSHIRRKADYFEGELAGSVQGLGLRGQVYWLYTLRTDALTWMIAYMQAVGAMDLLVFNFPAGNAAAEAQQRANANKIIGKAAIVCSRNPQGNWPAVEQVQMNSAGMKALHDLVADYFDRHIERLFVGQSMSSGADKGDGLGGTGRSEFAKATKDELLIYDTNRFDSTATYDLIRPLKLYNYPWAKFPVRFKSVLPDLKAKEKVDSGKVMVDMQIPIKTKEILNAADYSKPEIGDEVIATVIPGTPPVITKIGQDGKPEIPPEMLQQMMAPPGMGPGGPGGGMPPGGMPPGMGGPPGMPGSPQMPPGSPQMLPQGPPTQMAAQGPVGAPNAPYSVPSRPAGLPQAASPVMGYDGGGGGGAGGGMGAGMGSPGGGGGTPPANGPVMGYPGGGNTYIPHGPKYRDRRHPEDIIGFTRGTGYSRKPIRYGDVEDENAFHQLLDENPEDHQTRMIFADWLQDRGDPRAEGYRALGQLGKIPQPYGPGGISKWAWDRDYGHQPFVPSYWTYWPFNQGVAGQDDALPDDWLNSVKSHPDVMRTRGTNDEPRQSRAHPTRREVEDAAALAFGELSPEQKQSILGTQPTQASRYARITVRPGEPLMGGADFMHEIHDEQGNRVGHVWVSPMDNGERLHINHVGAMGHEANTLGPGVLRDAMRQLREHYPQAKRISGTRISGATKRNTGEDRPTEVQFARGIAGHYMQDLPTTIEQNRTVSRLQQHPDNPVRQIQDTAAGGVLADALDESGQPHAPFYRNLVHTYAPPMHMPAHIHNPLGRQDIPASYTTAKGRYENVGHTGFAAHGFELFPVIHTQTGERAVAATHRPDPPTPPRDRRRRNIPTASAPHHIAVMGPEELRQWASHEAIPEQLRVGILNAARDLAGQQQQEPTQSARFNRTQFSNYARSGACTRYDAVSAGKKLTPDEIQRARRVDLVVLPSSVHGTNCGNCSFGTYQGNNRIACHHPDVMLPVTERMCCAKWDSTGTKHVGRDYARDREPVRYADPRQAARQRLWELLHQTRQSGTPQAPLSEITHLESIIGEDEAERLREAANPGLRRWAKPLSGSIPPLPDESVPTPAPTPKQTGLPVSKRVANLDAARNSMTPEQALGIFRKHLSGGELSRQNLLVKTRIRKDLLDRALQHGLSTGELTRRTEWRQGPNNRRGSEAELWGLAKPQEQQTLTQASRYAEDLPHAESPDDLGSGFGAGRRNLLSNITHGLRGGTVKIEPRTGPSTDLPGAVAGGLQASQRRAHGQGYVQDTTAGKVLGDALDEAGEPHAPFFRNLIRGGDSRVSEMESQNGAVRELHNNPHPVRQQVITGGNDPIWLFSPGSNNTAVVHRRPFSPSGRGDAGTYNTSHVAVLDAPALREWASHPKVHPRLKEHLLNAANHLESQQPQPTQSARYERRHAPKGGITMNGREKPYKPGQFVPGTMMLTHTPRMRAPVSFSGPDSDDAFDPEQLAAGTRYESRTVKDPQQARNRAKDRLAKDPDFYRKVNYGDEPPRLSGDTASSATHENIPHMLAAISPQAWRGTTAHPNADYHPRVVAADYLQDLGRDREAELLRDTSKYLYRHGDRIYDAGELSRDFNANGLRSLMHVDTRDPHLAGYLRGALWASTDEHGEPLDENRDLNDIHPNTLAAMVADAHHFRAENQDKLEGQYGENEGRVGHNYWLSRNGHGAGFFDSPETYGEHTKALQDSARRHGEYNLYVGDDGLIHGDYEVSPNQQQPTQASRYENESSSQAHYEPVDFSSPEAFGQSLARAVTRHTGNQEHGNAALQLASKLTPAVFDRLKENRLTHFVSHPTPESLNQSWREDGSDPVLGAHSGRHKQIHFGPEDPIGTIAHELAHAFDWNQPYPGGGGYLLSGNPQTGWHSAWKQEIADSGTPEPKLTDYAEESPKEGLAEIYRLILTHPQGLQRAQKDFPQSFAVLKKWGVV